MHVRTTCSTAGDRWGFRSVIGGGALRTCPSLTEKSVDPALENGGAPVSIAYRTHPKL